MKDTRHAIVETVLGDVTIVATGERSSACTTRSTGPVRIGRRSARRWTPTTTSCSGRRDVSSSTT